MKTNGKNIIIIDKKAVKAALAQDWKAAITLNVQILGIDPTSIKAKNRLGKAYLQTKEFKKAAKLFREVLKIDPINPVATKNLEQAKSKKVKKPNGILGKKLVLEPGMAEEAVLELEGCLTAENFEKGEELKYRTNKASVTISKNGKNIGKVNSGIAGRLNNATKVAANVTVEFLKGKNKKITVLFRSDKPVLKATKQDVKPYVKKGTIEESALELPADS